MIIQTTDPILEIHDLTVAYNRQPVLWGVDLTLPKGKLIGIVGPNGAGKSTLIKACMGLIPLASGWIQLFGKPLEEVRSRISYVPQRESVDWDFPASVQDVVEMGRYGRLGLFKGLQKADHELVHDSLRKVGMEGFAGRQISQLSGGQQQRVFLARALAQEADLYFMDEPFAGVDAATERAILQLLQDMSDAGKTVVVVHHDLQSVEKYFDWVLLLNLRLVASGLVQEVFSPELLQQTYGGKLTVLSEVGELIKQTGVRTRRP
jgi:manganese/zinc/iron transport system ATP- binding protein